VHPVTILAINALTTDFHLNLGDHLLTREVEPASPDTSRARVRHRLVNLRQSDLQVSAVSQITIAADRAGDTATEVSLSVERLLNRLHGEVGVATVGHLPEGDLRVARQVNILCAVSYELHQTSSHCYIIAKENNLKNLNLIRRIKFKNRTQPTPTYAYIYADTRNLFYSISLYSNLDRLIL